MRRSAGPLLGEASSEVTMDRYLEDIVDLSPPPFYLCPPFPFLSLYLYSRPEWFFSISPSVMCCIPRRYKALSHMEYFTRKFGQMNHSKSLPF